MKPVVRKIYEFFSDIGIRDKLFLSFLFLISIPVLVIAVRSSIISSSIIEQKTKRYSHDILYQTTKTMETRLEKIEDISFNIIMNQEVQQMLSSANSGRLDEYEAAQTSIRMEKILSSHVLYHDEINAIYAISFGGYVYELDKTKQRYGLMEEQLDIILDAKGSTVWFGGLPNKRIVVLTRSINSTRTQKPIGYLIMYIDESFLFELIRSTHSVLEGNIFILDVNGITVSNSDKEFIGVRAKVSGINLQSKAYYFTTQMIDDTLHYVAQSEPMKNGWRIVTTVPVSVYQSEIIRLRNSIILFALLILVLSILCAWGIAMSISRPIRRLSSIMVQFGKGDFTVRCPEGAKDETGRLSETFNQMAENINILVQKVYEGHLMKREAELKSLQMQINPHFLYNTLETINWMARVHGTEDIGIMVKSLGDLMRATINDKDYVMLADEINNLNNYLKIQKYRYGNKFEAGFEIDPNTKKLYVPKLILQPLVENAIYHGIEPSIEKGVIQIKTMLDNKELIITVYDSGIGMTHDTISRVLDINSKEDNFTSHSIGLQNVIRRIKTLFGDDYGLEIHSELGEWTRIIVRLPVMFEVPKDL
jgi:two-component system sensor histidine kinase YesM